MSLEFTVRGSAVEPYAVRFWREGTTLHSSCTCQAASHGLACKHRLDLLAGDVTQLLAGSTADVQRLRELSAGTEVERALSSYEQNLAAPDLGLILLPLKPPGRRKAIPAVAATAALAGGGLAKGNTSYFDLYDRALTYVGSVKVRKGTVFSESPEDYFPQLSLATKRIIDGLVWERSQSMYVAELSSAFAAYFSSNQAHKDALRALKKAVIGP